jgi:hypothetical protein
MGLPSPYPAKVAAYRASLRQAARDAKRAGFTADADLLGALVDIQHILTGDRIDPEEDWPIPEALREAAERIARAADQQLNQEDA